MQKNIIKMLKNNNYFDKIREECFQSTKYPVLENVKREHEVTDLKQYYGNWVKGWTDDPKWINYGLIYNSKIISIAKKRHPITFEFLRKFKKKIFMAGYSMLKANGSIPEHRDEFLKPEQIKDDNVFHIGLFVPDKCFLKVNNNIVKHENRKFLSFNDSYLHSASNLSNNDRIVLYIKFYN